MSNMWLICICIWISKFGCLFISQLAPAGHSGHRGNDRSFLRPFIYFATENVQFGDEPVSGRSMTLGPRGGNLEMQQFIVCGQVVCQLTSCLAPALASE